MAEEKDVPAGPGGPRNIGENQKVGVYTSPIFQAEAQPARERRAGGTMTEPARQVPVWDEVDVLVIGGGPAGTAAATAAGRMGARTMLVERYNHLGGLATGGLVIWIDRMTDWDGNLVLRGFAEEILDRLPRHAINGPDKDLWGSRDERQANYWGNRFSAFHGTVTWAPMIDPEWLKIASDNMVREAGADVVLHAWASEPILDEAGAIEGVVLETKQGRLAVKCKVVIDTTGDGDIFVRAGEQSDNDIEGNSIHHCMNTSWTFAGIDVPKWLDFKMHDADGFKGFSDLARRSFNQFQLPMPAWRDDVVAFMGPRFSGFSAVELDDLNTVERLSRERMVDFLQFFRDHAPGFEDAWIMETAPQIGVRHSRRLRGLYEMSTADWKAGVIHEDEIGVSPSLGPKFDPVSIPYRALLPRRIPNLLTAGRHLSSDAGTHTFMREIPQCWVTGQAAGTAAAVAADSGVAVSAVDTTRVRAELVKNGTYLR